MNKLLPLFLVVLCSGIVAPANSQTLSQKVIASSGGYASNAAGSLSYTVGETVTPTITAGGYTLTQGFQQPYELQLQLNAFLQGYYTGSSMNDVLYNQGVYASPSTIADSITVELHQGTSPFTLVSQTKSVLAQNGTLTVRGLGSVGQSYYIVLKSRNHLETWSASPVLLNENTSYNFTTAATQAYGDNQVEVATGVYALYAGDINSDQTIDAFDYLVLEPDIIAGNSGYLSSDLNGDGSVDAFDYLVLDPNIVSGISASTP